MSDHEWNEIVARLEQLRNLFNATDARIDLVTKENILLHDLLVELRREFRQLAERVAV